MPTIEVFLMFKPTDRNSHTTTDDKHKKTKIIEAGPAWNWIKAELAKKGYTLIVHGPSAHPSIQEIRDAMSNAEVTLLVGHGSNPNPVPGKFIADQILLSDGIIRSPDGVLTGQWNATGGLDNKTAGGTLSINRVTGIFTCNSTDKLPDAFDLPPGTNLITNDGGKDGLTRVGTLELGAAEFVTWYGLTKGDVRRSMSKAQFVFTQKGEDWASDKGDKLSDKVGVTPPPPPMCEVKDW